MKPEMVIILLIVLGMLQLGIYKESFPSNSVELTQGHLAYKQQGAEGPVMILIHGSPGSKNDFKLLQPRIEGHTVYALDMYGFGESEKYVKKYGIENQARVVSEFMQAKNITQATILGYSWGGGVALEFAALFPEKTTKLILLDGMGLQEGEATGSYFGEHARYLISYPFVVFYPGALAGDEGWRHGFMRSFMDSDQRVLREKMNQISAPTLILHGSEDTVIEPWVAEEHARLIKNSKIVWFHGGHGTIFSNVTEIAPAVQEFLNE